MHASKSQLEYVTVSQALARVGLGDLAPDYGADWIVGWTGYPQPFACGHTAIYGFGPLDSEEKNDSRGAGRRYQQLARVSQHVCGGHVLFSWARYSGDKSPFQLRGGLAVVVTETDDSHAMCLKVVFSG